MANTSKHIGIGACFIAATMLGGVGARGDDGDPKARAQALFLEGRKAIDADDYATGCPKIRESLALFTVANSLFSAAQCDEHEGKIASALEHWERGAALIDATDPRTKVAKDRIAALEPRVPRIRVVLPPSNASPTILLDDTELTTSALAAPLRVNPGKHVFVVRATGHEDTRREIDIAEKERTEFVATIGPVQSGTPTPTVTASASAPPPPPPPPPSNGRRTTGFIVGGVGVLGLLAAGGTGIRINSLRSELDGCNNGATCLGEKQAGIDEYKALLVGNAIATGIGVAGLATAVVLILTAPKASDDKPANAMVVPLVMPNGAGIGLSGRF